MAKLTRNHYLSYALICLIWGSTWGAIRLLVRDVPPLRAAAIRFFLAAIILLIAAITRARLFCMSLREWRALVMLAITRMGLTDGLQFWAVDQMRSSMTAV